MLYHTIPDSAIATVVYKDAKTERFWACINTAGRVDYLESMIPNDKRAGEHNRLHATHLAKLPIKKSTSH